MGEDTVAPMSGRMPVQGRRGLEVWQRAPLVAHVMEVVRKISPRSTPFHAVAGGCARHKFPEVG